MPRTFSLAIDDRRHAVLRGVCCSRVFSGISVRILARGIGLRANRVDLLHVDHLRAATKTSANNFTRRRVFWLLFYPSRNSHGRIAGNRLEDHLAGLHLHVFLPASWLAPFWRGGAC